LIKAGDPETSKCFGKLEKQNNNEKSNLHGCWENLHSSLLKYDIAYEDIPSTFNLFQNIEIGHGGELVWKLEGYRSEPGKPDHVTLRAEMNCLVALSVCPSGGTVAKPVKVQVFKE
jgi:uncharacterized protein YcgI (DUF1989 family)